MCPVDKRKLALIHIIKKELKLSDSEYRRMLKEAAGVESSKYLDDNRFRQLMNYFVRSRHYRVNSFGLTIRQKLYIKYLAREIGWSPEHLDNFLNKYYRKSRVDDLNRKEAAKVIESLKNIRQRHS